MIKFLAIALVLAATLSAAKADDGIMSLIFYTPYATISDYFTNNDLEEAQAAQAEAETADIIAAAKTREAAVKSQLSDTGAAEEAIESAEEAQVDAAYANEVAAEETLEALYR